MLVLRRKAGESVVLAGVITVTILAIEGERVKIGISAPPALSIVREELFRRGTEWSQGEQKLSEHHHPERVRKEGKDFKRRSVDLSLDGESDEEDEGPFTPGDTTSLYAFVDAVMKGKQRPIISTFKTADGFLVDWFCPQYGEDRSSRDWFEVFFQGTSLGCETMYHDLDEEALQLLAERIAPGKPATEILGQVSSPADHQHKEEA